MRASVSVRHLLVIFVVGVLTLVALQMSLVQGHSGSQRDARVVSRFEAQNVASETGSARGVAPGRTVQIQTGAGPVSLHSDHISIQTAAQKACEQAGLVYDWRRSYRNTAPDCRRYIGVDLDGATVREALEAIVETSGLGYERDGKHVWLVRPPPGPANDRR